MTYEELKAAATAMMDRAYCPYSHFPVGAALECDDGSVYTGCNVESAAFPAGICAERNALGSAVADGHTNFVRIVVAGKSEDYCYPCGVCRQALVEFSPDMEVVSLNRDGNEKRLLLRELIPHSFGPHSLPEP